MNSIMTSLRSDITKTESLEKIESASLVALGKNLNFRWFCSVDEIDPETWGRCFHAYRFARTHRYQQTVEASAPNGVSFQYLVAYDGDVVWGIVGCFRYRVPLSTTATGSARKMMRFIERFLPGLFSINGFFVGQLTSVCDHLYGFEQIAEAQRSAFLARCEPVIQARARKLRASVIIHKEIPEDDLDLVIEALGDDYMIAPSLPAMELSLQTSEPYEKQLRKKYRNHYRRRQRSADEMGLSWDIHRGPINEVLAKDIERLYLGILERSTTQFERLSSNYFSSIMDHFPGASVVLCKDGETLVGFMVNVESENDFHGLYLGYDVSYRDGAVYFNLIYRSLEVAQELGFQSIHLGQTSYEIKSALGAKPTNLHLALRASCPVVHGLIKFFRHHLFPEINVPNRRAFHITC